MQATGPLAMVRLNKNPGPGSYELGDTLSKGSFSLRPKTHYDNNEGRRVPGPGNCRCRLNQTQIHLESIRQEPTSSPSTKAVGQQLSTLKAPFDSRINTVKCQGQAATNLWETSNRMENTSTLGSSARW